MCVYKILILCCDNKSDIASFCLRVVVQQTAFLSFSSEVWIKFYCD